MIEIKEKVSVLFVCMGNMHLYELTWPTAVLQELGEQVVTLESMRRRDAAIIYFGADVGDFLNIK